MRGRRTPLAGPAPALPPLRRRGTASSALGRSRAGVGPCGRRRRRRRRTGRGIGPDGARHEGSRLLCLGRFARGPRVGHNSYMPQAGPLPWDSPASGQARPPAASVSDVAVNQIQASLQVIARSISQVRTHERLLQSAGVRLDRAGAAALAEMLDVDTPTVTRKVQQLERDGLVVRHADPADGRASRIRLTPVGRRTLERVLKARRAWLDGMLAGWDEEDLARFGSLLGRFSASLEHEMEDARGS